MVHHQSEEYNLTVALRQSILQSLYGAPLLGIYGFLGFDFKMVLAVTSLNTLSQFWIHTRYIDRLPRLFEAFFNSPSHHRVHHGRNEQYIDKNYGGAFIIWDRIFGTFEPEDEPVRYGITVAPKTWNPFLRSVQYTQCSGKEKQSWSLKDKLKAFWKPPGWDPKGQILVDAGERAKYNPAVSSRQKQMSLLIFTTVLGTAAYYLFTIHIWGGLGHSIFLASLCLGLWLASML